MSEKNLIDANALANAIMGTVNLAKSEDDDAKMARAKKLKENRAAAKAHLAKLEKEAEDEKDEEQAEKLGKKAKKLAAKLAENEDEEVDLSEYKVDEASLADTSKEVRELKRQLKSLTLLMAEVQQNQVKLMAAPAPTKDQVIANLSKALEEAQTALKGTV